MGKSDLIPREKSLLDNIPVDDSQYREVMARAKKQRVKDIVGSCPVCGSPVYGFNYVIGDEKPEVTYSCGCRNKASQPFQDQISTK